MKVISIAKDFTVFPGGRTPEDGPFSGQEFRDNFLIPALVTGEAFAVDFDHVRGYGSSFLEEAFGGLLRKGIALEQIKKLMTLISSKESIIAEVNRYLEAADKNK